jgi:hypothetical protein
MAGQVSEALKLQLFDYALNNLYRWVLVRVIGDAYHMK